MSDSIKNPRNGCALHGGIQTVEEISGIVPIIHANAGCGVINYLANKASGVGSGRYSGLSIPGTASQERHVIFGGASRLREQIKNTIKVVDGELYVILNSCESAMVGDDVDAMTREIVEQGEPVVDTLSAGFNGSSHYGYEHVLADILKSLDTVKTIDTDKQKNLINIFGIVPQKDLFWNGNLQEIRRIFNEVGIETNIFFGPVSGVEELIKASKASLSIVFSRWGELPAKILEEKYQIPFIYQDSLPVVSEQFEKLFSEIINYTDADNNQIEKYIEKIKQQEIYYRQRIFEELVEERIISKVVIVADEADAIRYATIATKWLCAEVEAIILTDALKKDEDHKVNNSNVLEELANKIYISQDGKEIESIIRRHSPEVVLGSSLEREVTDKLQIPLIEVSYPIFQNTILTKNYVGINGALTLVEDFISKAKESRKVKKERLLKVVSA